MSNQWQAKESEGRKKNFLADYDKLVEKYEVALMAVPQFVPSGQQGFNISAMLIPIDRKESGVVSPMNDEIIKK
jgi:hypothetical protein